MIEDIKKEASQRMRKCADVLGQNLGKIRTGRAHTSLLDHVTVPYYGNEVPLNQAATVAVADARTLTVTPWEKSMVAPIEKAIMTSDLGINPSTAGTVIRLALPPLTEERRRDLVRLVRQEGESGRVAVRNVRRDAISDIKEMEKEKLLSEDESRKAQEVIQKLTDDFVAQIDRILDEKEQELMQI